MSGQPKGALSPAPCSMVFVAGSIMVGPGQTRNMADQPPSLTGAREVRFCTTVPQSTISGRTLRPSRRNRSMPTSAWAASVVTLVGPRTRMSSPL